jgi:two-component system sensor histidine kinase SenX3
LAETKHILLEYQSREPYHVLGDKTSLVELLVILLDNAIKYSPEKTTVHISEQPSQKFLAIHVKDEGPGLTPEEQEHIFERFYRTDSSRTHASTHGYGLGLSIAENIIRLHDGGLTVTSSKGKGSTFIVTLPFTKAA